MEGNLLSGNSQGVTVSGNRDLVQTLAIADELVAGKLHQLSDIALPDYGYFIVRPDRATASEAATMFSDWLEDAVSARNQSRNASAS